MFKHILAMIILSILAVVFKSELTIVLHTIVGWHQHVLAWLSTVFSEDKFGLIARDALALLIIPLVVGACVAFVLWITKRKMLPYLPEMMWIVWLLLLALVGSV